MGGGIRRRAFAVALVACFALVVVPQGAAAHVRRPSAGPALPLGHAGRWVTDARGRVFITHGISMVYKIPPYYPSAAGFGANDAAFLRSIGFNSVRVGVIWKGLEPTPGHFSTSYLTHIAMTVRTLAHYGIVSLLDFHQDMLNELFQGEGFPNWAVEDGGLSNPKLGFPANYVGDPALEHALDQFFDDAPGPDGIGLQTWFARAWRSVATTFLKDRSVLGYELFNEPFPGTSWEQCFQPAGCAGFDAKLLAFYKRVDTAIRQVDHRTLVWYEPSSLFNYGVNTQLGPLGDPNAGFAFHDYCSTEPTALTAPDPPTCETADDSVFAHALAHAKQTGNALLMTEFGATQSSAYLDDMVARADRNMVPWNEWAYCGCHDPTTTGPGSTEAIVLNPANPPRGGNLVMSTLHALVEPYPQVVAGTPVSWGYNRTTRAFTALWSTRRASGHGRFGVGSVSDIAAPKLDYPHGYRVRVTGARVVSRPGAAVLLVATSHGARRVEVTVTPRG
jgi:endoglycosylceramidase